MKDFRVLDSIGKTAEDLSSGELLQIEKSLNKNMSEDIYYNMIEKKTASLIGTACELGAISVTEKETEIKAMKNFGINLGIAFQIKDDLFDLLGSKIETGKDVASDIIGNMITLPVVYSLNNSSSGVKKNLNRLLRKSKKSKNYRRELVKIIESTGGFEYAYQKIDHYSNLAFENLKIFPASIYKDKLTDLVKYNGNRKK